MPWQLCICVCKSRFWCHTNPCVKVLEQTWGQPQQEPLLVASLITCADGDALTRSFCALIGPRGQMRSFIGLQLTQGSKKEVVINTESRSIFLLPGRQQTAFCWAISVFSTVRFPLFVSPFFFLFSAFLSFLSFFLPLLSLSSLVPSDLELICLFKFLPVLYAWRRRPFPSPFPLFSLQQPSENCLVWNETEQIGFQY